jgi:very-short-patch-repair endonuclease
MRFTEHPVDGNDHKRAKELRRQASPFEQDLWFWLRQASKNTNLKFRFQQPIHPYFVDFACMKVRLVIELDGMSHDTSHVYDQKREDYLRKKGYTIIRFTNDQVRQNPAGVAETIVLQAKELMQKLEN